MIIELEFAEGLEDIVQKELSEKLKAYYVRKTAKGYLTIQYDGQTDALLKLKSINTVYESIYFDIPRPRALLGHEHFHRLLNHIKAIGLQGYQTLFISAAGSETSVMQRIKQDLAQELGLTIGDNSGDLWLRMKRQGNGWEVLIRLTPRPSATRQWRVCDFEGALNAPVAYAMGAMISPADVVVNLMCGSGTLMIEYPHQAKQLIGVDWDEAALDCAFANIQASSSTSHIELIKSDVASTPLSTSSVDALLADLPFGQLVGSHQNNQSLYPKILKEAARIAKKSAQFIIITHEIKLMENTLSKNQDWHVESVRRVSLRGYHPRIFLLRKN